MSEPQATGWVLERGVSQNLVTIGDATAGRMSIASQVQMWLRCSGLVRQHMCSPVSVHGISSIQV